MTKFKVFSAGHILCMGHNGVVFHIEVVFDFSNFMALSFPQNKPEFNFVYILHT